MRILTSLRRVAVLGLAIVGLASTGCLELSQAYTLNPDGSGKVVVDTVTPAGNPFAPAGAEQPPVAETVKKTIQERLDKACGVDAWSDISCEVTKEGKVHFKGTAYFSDINKLNVDDGGGGGVIWAKEGDGMTLTVKNKDKDANAPAEEALTDAQIKERMTQERMQFQQMKPMMAAMVGSLKVQMSYTLPGKVTESNILTAEGNTVSMTMTGTQLINAMEKINADDKLMTAKLKAGKAGEDDFMFEQIFGKKGPMKAKVTGADKPLFDYKAEMGKAKAGEAALFQKLGVKPGSKENIKPSLPGF